MVLSEESTEFEDALKNDLRAMVDDPNYSDIQFVCSDGGRVHACRMLLVARSDVLKGMLTNGMSESRLTKITLRDIRTEAMLMTVEYLYTGMIVRYKLTLASAFQALHASRFFLLDKMEKYVMDKLGAAVREDADPDLVIWCFSQFAEFADMEGTSSIDAVSEYMAEWIDAMAVESQSLRNLSARAMSLYLHVTKQLFPFNSYSFKEYLRLRSIMLWAGSNVSSQVEKLVMRCLPDEQRLRESFQTIKRSARFCEDGGKLFVLEPHVRDELNTWVKKLASGWSSVNFQHIHPQLLVKVIEPLNLIPRSRLSSALKYQALNADAKTMLKCCVTSSGGIVTNSGVVFQCTSDSRAICVLRRGINHGLYEWEITVEIPCMDMRIRLGDLSTNEDSDEYLDLSQKGYLICRTRERTEYGKPFSRKGSKVRVRIDMTSRTCGFTINGQDFGVAWIDLDRELFLAVNLTYAGKVSVQVISDPDDI